MKNILKFGLLTRFVALFLFIFGINTLVTSPALAGGSPAEAAITYNAGDCDNPSLLSLDNQTCDESNNGSTGCILREVYSCPGKTLTGWYLEFDCDSSLNGSNSPTANIGKPWNACGGGDDSLVNITAVAQWEASDTLGTSVNFVCDDGSYAKTADGNDAVFAKGTPYSDINPPFICEGKYVGDWTDDIEVNQVQSIDLKDFLEYMSERYPNTNFTMVPSSYDGYATIKVTLDNQSATTAGTTEYYYKFNTYNGSCYYFSNSSLTTCLAGAKDGTKITIPTRTGYTFGGYYTGKNGAGIQYVDPEGKTINNIYKAVDTPTTLYAQWEVPTITLNNNGATTAPRTKLYFNTSDSLFYTDEKLRTQIASSDLPVKKYTVTYNAQSGTVSPTSASAQYTFDGYTVTIKGVEYKVIDSTGKLVSANMRYLLQAMDQDLSATAQWTGTPSVTLPMPTRSGYTFKGWYTSATNGTRVGGAGANYTVSDNITLYAQWTAQTYTITLDSKYYASESATNGTNVSSWLIPDTIYEHYNNGWYEDSGLSMDFTSLTELPIYDKYVFAGVFTGKAGTGTQVIASDGRIIAPNFLFNSDATIYAHYIGCSCEHDESVSSCSAEGTSGLNDNYCYYTVTCADGYSDNNGNRTFTGSGNKPGVPNYTPTCKKVGLTTGYTCPADSTRYISCYEGKYMATMDASGNYVYNGTPTSGNSCQPCPADAAYCPGGTSAPLYAVMLEAEGLQPEYNILLANVNAEYYKDLVQDEETGNVTATRLEGTLPAEFMPTAPDGKTFNGYWTEGGEQYIDANGNFLKGPSADVTLYAQWEQDQYIISYACGYGDGTAPSQTTCDAGTECLLANSTCAAPAEYMFSGWKIGDTVYDNFTDISSKLSVGTYTATAQYEKIEPEFKMVAYPMNALTTGNTQVFGLNGVQGTFLFDCGNGESFAFFASDDTSSITPACKYSTYKQEYEIKIASVDDPIVTNTDTQTFITRTGNISNSTNGIITKLGGSLGALFGGHELADFSYTFLGATSLTEIEATLLDGFETLHGAEGMFTNATNLTNIPLNLLTPKNGCRVFLNGARQMFAGSSKTKQSSVTDWDGNVTNYLPASLYERLNSCGTLGVFTRAFFGTALAATCPAGTYEVGKIGGKPACAPCPANSSSEAGATSCTCNDGYNYNGGTTTTTEACTATAPACVQLEICAADGADNEYCRTVYQRANDPYTLYGDEVCSDGSSLPLDALAGYMPNAKEPPVGFYDVLTDTECVDSNMENTGKCAVAADGSSTWVVKYQCEDGYTGSNGDIYVYPGDACSETVYTITLDMNGGNANGAPGQIYEKPNDGWYVDGEKIDNIGRSPIKDQYVFSGFFTEQNGTGTQVIASDGRIIAPNFLFDSDDEVFAYYTNCDCTPGDGVSKCSIMGTASENTCLFNVTCKSDYSDSGNDTDSDGKVEYVAYGKPGVAEYTATCKKIGLTTGYTCPADSTRYTSCHEGKYMATMDASGNYVYNGTPTSGNSCQPCPADAAYCPGGTSAPLYAVMLEAEGLQPEYNILLANVNAEYYKDLVQDEETGNLTATRLEGTLPAEFMPTAPDGKTFNGYWTEGGEQYIDANGIFQKGPSADVTLRAQWVQLECPAGTYESGGVCVKCPSNSYSEAGKSYCNCNNGFSIGGTGNQIANTGEPCVPTVYTVELDNKGADTPGTEILYKTKIDNVSQFYEDKDLQTPITQIEIPTKKGHKFLGYAIDDSAGAPKAITATGRISDSSGYTGDGSIKLYAIYQPDCYQIDLDPYSNKTTDSKGVDLFIRYDDQGTMYHNNCQSESYVELSGPDAPANSIFVGYTNDDEFTQSPVDEEPLLLWHHKDGLQTGDVSSHYITSDETWYPVYRCNEGYRGSSRYVDAEGYCAPQSVAFAYTCGDFGTGEIPDDIKCSATSTSCELLDASACTADLGFTFTGWQVQNKNCWDEPSILDANEVINAAKLADCSNETLHVTARWAAACYTVNLSNPYEPYEIFGNEYMWGSEYYIDTCGGTPVHGDDIEKYTFMMHDIPNATFAGYYSENNENSTQCVDENGKWTYDCRVTDNTTYYELFKCNEGYTANGEYVDGINTQCAANVYTVNISYDCGDPAGVGDESTPPEKPDSCSSNKPCNLPVAGACGYMGYTFTGWKIKLNSGNTITVPAGENVQSYVNADETEGSWSVTAQWTPVEYDITYNTNGGELVGEYPETYTIVTPTFDLPTPVKEGHVFGGWYSPAPISQIVKGSTGNIEITATWTPIEYEISYNTNGGELVGEYPETYTIVTPTFDLPTPVQDGYDFVGWFNKAGEQVTEIATGSTGNIELTAQWKAKTFTCKSGEYLDVLTCEQCPEGYKCPQTQFTYNKKVQGLTACSGATEYQDQAGQTTCKTVSDGYYKTADNKQQIVCGNGYYCKNAVRTVCPDNGLTDTATASDVTDCYKNNQSCTVDGGVGMSDVCHYDTTKSGYKNCDVCIINGCNSGYYKDGDACTICPKGSYCANSDINACPDKYTTADRGATKQSDCFTTCDNMSVEYGIAHADKATVYAPAVCTYSRGESDTGNPCDIKNGKCVETSCKFDYEMKGGKCTECVRDNARTFKQGNGNCVVESCEFGYQPFGQSCVPATKECTTLSMHAIAAQQTWDTKTNSYTVCQITECADGYHISNNTCISDEQTCNVANGIGVQTWNGSKWGNCVATKCNPGYTNDPDLVRPAYAKDISTQCGRCDNAFDINGEEAAHTYVRECEIATCMYQGKKYILENNECRLICNKFEDETGSRYWDSKSEKCVHTCNAGYQEW